jgi:dTMP kinase
MAALKRGVLIAIEGIDGAGSSTQTKMLVVALLALGYPAVATKEPNPLGHVEATIRALLQEMKAQPALDALLFAADRVEHVERFIKPWLREKKAVVTDRYLESTLAYQSAQGLDPRWILSINRGAIKPDLTIILDVDPDLSLTRKNLKPDRYEQTEFLMKVRANYARRARRKGYLILDSTEPKDEVHRLIMVAVLKVIKKLV